MRTKINGYDVIHINKETGEVICETKECTSIEDNQLSESEKKHQEYIDSHVMNFNKSEGFVKLFTDTIYELSKILSRQEFQFTLGLSKFVSYEDCALKIGYGRANHYMDLHEISDVMGVEYTRSSRVVKSLIQKGILGKVVVGNRYTKMTEEYYIVNPYIYINGKNPNKIVCDYFENSGWKELFEKNEIAS